MALPYSALYHDRLIDVYFLKNNKFKYSDGEKIENYILTALREAKDTGIFSEELHNKIKDWPSYYHLSSLRQNICRPIQIDNTHDILEIGSGCGAITRYLAETAHSVTCIEGGYMRALSTRARCKGLDNVTVINADFNDLQFDQKFDIITLIGVFEYTAKYSEKDNPFETALADYKSLLKPNGRIIIAIENKLGIKYFMGQGEDHYGKPYYGTENRYKEKEIRTFGRSEIEKMAIKLELSPYFYFPFPDYKVPKVVLTSEVFQHQDLNIYDLIALHAPVDYTGNTDGNFDYFLSLKSIIDNNLLPDMSNSFLAELSVKAPSPQNNLAFHYSTERKNGYNTETKIYLDDAGIKVSKALIAGQILKPGTALIKHNIDKESMYVYGDTLIVQMIESIKKENFERFEYLLKLWYGFLIGNIIDKSKFLRAGFADCLPQNIIVDKKGVIHYIDAEWEYMDAVSIEFMIVRLINTIRAFLGKEKVFSTKYGISVRANLKKISFILNIERIYNVKDRLKEEDIFFDIIIRKYPNYKKSRRQIGSLLKKIQSIFIFVFTVIKPK